MGGKKHKGVNSRQRIQCSTNNKVTTTTTTDNNNNNNNNYNNNNVHNRRGTVNKSILGHSYAMEGAWSPVPYSHIHRRSGRRREVGESRGRERAEGGREEEPLEEKSLSKNGFLVFGVYGTIQKQPRGASGNGLQKGEGSARNFETAASKFPKVGSEFLH